MKLELHLIPKSAFYSSLRDYIGPAAWSIISKDRRAAAHHTCQICGSVGSTHLHEVWEFDKSTLRQILKGYEVVCPDCHAVHHWGHSRATGKDMKHLVDHACKINNCNREEFGDYVDRCFEEWEVLSCYKWFLYFGDNFEEFLKKR